MSKYRSSTTYILNFTREHTVTPDRTDRKMLSPGVIGPPVLAYNFEEQSQYSYPLFHECAPYYMQTFHAVQQSVQPIPAPGNAVPDRPATVTREALLEPDDVSVPMADAERPASHPRHFGLAFLSSQGSANFRAERTLQMIRQISEEGRISMFYRQAWFKCLVAFLVWLFAGVVFYSQWQEWSFFASLYYTVQAGMSIGFGFPSEDFVCEKQTFRSGNAAKFYAEQQYDEPINNGRGGCLAGDISKLVTVILILSGSRLLLSDVEHKHLKMKALQTETWADDIEVWARRFWRKSAVKAILRFLLWSGVGVVYGMLSEQRMSFLTALYFSISSISTAGLESLKPLGPSSERGAEIQWDEIHDGHFAFLSLFCIIGVPLYGWALTTIAAGFVGHLNHHQMRRAVYEKLTEDELQLTLCLGDGEEVEEVDMHKFVELQLLRLNKVSVSDLFFIKKAFRELDVDRSGTISRSELVQTGAKARGTEEADPLIQLALSELRSMHTELLRQTA